MSCCVPSKRHPRTIRTVCDMDCPRASSSLDEKLTIKSAISANGLLVSVSVVDSTSRRNDNLLKFRTALRNLHYTLFIAKDISPIRTVES